MPLCLYAFSTHCGDILPNSYRLTSVRHSHLHRYGIETESLVFRPEATGRSVSCLVSKHVIWGGGGGGGSSPALRIASMEMLVGRGHEETQTGWRLLMEAVHAVGDCPVGNQSTWRLLRWRHPDEE